VCAKDPGIPAPMETQISFFQGKMGKIFSEISFSGQRNMAGG
jgi:hypothetical protein